MRKTMLTTAILVATGMMLTNVAASNAQMSGMSMPAAKVGTQSTPAKAMEDLMMFLEDGFMGAAKAMPADKYNFSPESLAIPGAKFDKVRTFADQVKHVAQANYFFASTVSGTKPEADLKAIGAMKGKDEIVAALAGSFAALHKAYATLTADNALEVVSFEGSTASRATVASFAVAHGFDHYGQMVEYLRMNGIVPPASAK